MGKIAIDNDLQSLIPSCRSCKSCPKTLLFDLKFQVRYGRDSADYFGDIVGDSQLANYAVLTGEWVAGWAASGGG